MGVFEFSNFAQGTIGVCKSIAALDDAITIIGGGDSAAAAISLDLLMTLHISLLVAVLH